MLKKNKNVPLIKFLKIVKNYFSFASKKKKGEKQ